MEEKLKKCSEELSAIKSSFILLASSADMEKGGVYVEGENLNLGFLLYKLILDLNDKEFAVIALRSILHAIEQMDSKLIDDEVKEMLNKLGLD